MKGLALGLVQQKSAVSPTQFEGTRMTGYSPEPIMVYLSMNGSPLIPLKVLESDSIASVKLRIQNCRGFIVKNQRLVFDGRELARNNTLIRDYGVENGNVIHLIIRLSDLRAITIETMCGKKLKFEVDQKQNIGYLKQEVAKRGVDIGEPDQKLVFDGQELDDHKLITDICRDDSGVIHLLICKSSKVRVKAVERDTEMSIVAPALPEITSHVDSPVVEGQFHARTTLIEPVVRNPSIRLSPMIMRMVHDAYTGLEKGNTPVMSSEGTGGVYFMQDESGRKYVAVFKPMDEEPMAENNPRGLPLSKDGEGLKRGTQVGEGALREVASYILDHPVTGPRVSEEVGFAGVPPTLLVQCKTSFVNRSDGCSTADQKTKIGSLQMYVKNCGTCEDMGPRAFPVEEVHKIAVLDIRLANADRHAGNILVCNDNGRAILVPIDHGYCLPKSFEDCTFDWLYWPQARKPFEARTLRYIESLDAEGDISLLKHHGWDLPVECSRILRICTLLLKKGAARGLTPFDIGSMLCRENLKKESKIEEIVNEAKGDHGWTSEAELLDSISRIIDRHLETC